MRAPIADHMGAFAQVTYEQPADHFSIDNTDIRYARDYNWGDHTMVWGLTLNNNPPCRTSGTAPRPGVSIHFFGSGTDAAAAPLLAGALAQNVAGPGRLRLARQHLVRRGNTVSLEPDGSGPALQQHITAR